MVVFLGVSSALTAFEELFAAVPKARLS